MYIDGINHLDIACLTLGNKQNNSHSFLMVLSQFSHGSLTVVSQFFHGSLTVILNKTQRPEAAWKSDGSWMLFGCLSVFSQAFLMVLWMLFGCCLHVAWFSHGSLMVLSGFSQGSLDAAHM